MQSFIFLHLKTPIITSDWKSDMEYTFPSGENYSSRREQLFQNWWSIIARNERLGTCFLRFKSEVDIPNWLNIRGLNDILPISFME